MALDRDIALLQRQPLLGLIETEGLRLLAFASETRILRAGDVLFRKGDASDGGYLVVSGALALDASDDGSPSDIIAGPGTLIGEIALFAAGKRPATAISREPSTVMRLPARLVHRVLTEFPDSAARVRAALASRMTAMTREMERVRARLEAIDAKSS